MKTEHISILSTKKLPATLVRAAYEDGLQIDCISFIETIPVNSPYLSEQVKLLSHEQAYVAFTSGIAAKAVAALLVQQPVWNIFSLHSQTKTAVEECFPNSTIIATAQNGEELAKEILKHDDVQELVFFCGDKRMNILPAILPGNGILLKEYVAYETKLTPVKIDKAYKAILFYSPSGVESFYNVNTTDINIPLFSMGSSTTKAIEKRVNNKVYTAAHATLENVVDLVKQIINSNKCN